MNEKELRKMDAVVALLDSMSESERKDYIENNLSIADVYTLYNVYGYATELGDGKIAASYNDTTREYNNRETA